MQFCELGYQILPAVFDQQTCESLAEQIAYAISTDQESGIESRVGIVGGRNLIECWNGWRQIVSMTGLTNFVKQHCGVEAGLVRILYFDKPPGSGWSLSLHRDKTIAVDRHRDPAEPFSKPTRKVGVPHVEATIELLAGMLTLRVHLDAMTDENGPVVVVPGSHRMLADGDSGPTTVVHCGQGDVFAMRPLLLHGSLAPDPTTRQHRRVIHLEFTGQKNLPAGYQWYQFHPLA